MTSTNETSGKPEKNSHCSFCGNAFPLMQPWPRRCGQCGNTSYLNPLPVAVVLVPIDDGLLVVRRSIPPKQGMLALPGGFITVGESWQEAGAREVLEETGLSIDPSGVRLFDALSAPDGTLLIFGLAKQRSAEQMPPFTPNNEVSETTRITAPTELAFPLHTQVMTRFFGERTAAWQIDT